VGHAKCLVDSVSRHPNDSVCFVHDERHGIPLVPCHFAIYEEVLELLSPAEAHRPELVARAPIPHPQTPATTIAPDNRHCGIVAKAFKIDHPIRRCFGRQHTSGQGH
jgi:hypothetical protein